MHFDLNGLSLPITLRPAVALTDEELIRFSERNKPFRIERNKEGELTVMTPAGGIGGSLEGYVSAALIMWAAEDGRGIAFSPSTGFNLPDGSCLSPDGAWIPFTRWNALTPEQQASFPPVCPEFIIEVRSRTDSRKLLEAKMLTWIENGAQLAWLVDPVDGNVVIYRSDAEPETLIRPEVVRGSGMVQGFALHAARLWSSK